MLSTALYRFSTNQKNIQYYFGIRSTFCVVIYNDKLYCITKKEQETQVETERETRVRLD